MTNHVICVRNVEKGKFGNEPGATYFLDVPDTSSEISVNHKSPKKKKEWFLDLLNKAAEASDDTTNCSGDILVFIHGYNNSQKTVLKRHKLIKKSLKKQGFKGLVVSFDWPSANKAINYLEDRSDAKKTAIKLVDDCIKAFSILQTEDCKINVHLLAHSMGAYVVREAFDDADDRPKVASSNWSVSQVLFVGADVSSKSMSRNNPKSSSIYRHSIRLTNYSNPFDSALKLSNVKRIGVAPRVGRIGLPEELPYNSINVNCGEYYQTHEDRLKNTSGTPSHSWYIGDDGIAKDMYLTLMGDIDRNSIPTRVVKRDGSLHLL